MSKAFNHFVRPMTEQELNRQINWGKNAFKFQNEHPDDREPKPEQFFIDYYRKCKISNNCNNISTKILTYNYVTGRRGNISFAEKPVCDEHAEKYEK